MRELGRYRFVDLALKADEAGGEKLDVITNECLVKVDVKRYLDTSIMSRGGIARADELASRTTAFHSSSNRKTVAGTLCR